MSDWLAGLDAQQPNSQGEPSAAPSDSTGYGEWKGTSGQEESIEDRLARMQTESMASIATHTKPPEDTFDEPEVPDVEILLGKDGPRKVDYTCFPGAVNPNPNCFDHGSHDGHELVALGSNCFVVILLGGSLNLHQVPQRFAPCAPIFPAFARTRVGRTHAGVSCSRPALQTQVLTEMSGNVQCVKWSEETGAIAAAANDEVGGALGCSNVPIG